MRDQNCIICGREVGIPGQLSLKDGHFICRECEKKVSPYFITSECTTEQYYGNIKQSEDGLKLYEAYFNKNRKAVRLCDNQVVYDSGTGLICICGERGGIFGKTRFYNVFKMSDLESYEQTSRFFRDENGSNSRKTCVSLSFGGIREGLSDFTITTDKKAAQKLISEFNQALGKRAKGISIFTEDTKRAFGRAVRSSAEGSDFGELEQIADEAIAEVLKEKQI